MREKNRNRFREFTDTELSGLGEALEWQVERWSYAERNEPETEKGASKMFKDLLKEVEEMEESR